MPADVSPFPRSGPKPTPAEELTSRRKELITELSDEFGRGGKVSTSQRILIKRAAMLLAIMEKKEESWMSDPAMTAELRLHQETMLEVCQTLLKLREFQPPPRHFDNHS